MYPSYPYSMKTQWGSSYKQWQEAQGNGNALGHRYMTFGINSSFRTSWTHCLSTLQTGGDKKKFSTELKYSIFSPKPPRNIVPHEVLLWYLVFVRYGEIWQDSVRYGDIWWDSVRFGSKYGRWLTILDHIKISNSPD